MKGKVRLAVSVGLFVVSIGQVQGRVVSALIPVADTVVHEFSESTATDGSNWLVAVRGSSGNADEACAQLMSSDGLIIGSLIQTGRLIHTPTDGDLPPFRAPFVAFGGGKYLMVWVDHASGGKVYGQFISTVGTLVGSAFAISFDGDKYLPDVASDGTNFFVIWTDWGGTEGRFVSSSGALGSQVEISFANDIASVAYGGGQYLVGWMTSSDGNSLPQCRLVSSDGTMGSTLTLGSSSLYYESLNVAYGDGRFMTAWSHTGGNIDLKGRMVLPNGTLVGPELDLVSDALNEMSVGHCLAHDGDYFLLAWVASDFGVGVDDISYGQYVDSDGNMLGSPFVIDSSPDVAGAMDFITGLSASQGKAMALITTDAFGSGGNVYAVMIDSSAHVQLESIGTGQLQLEYSGILESTTNLTSETWLDVSPQPASPWVISPADIPMFYRTRRIE
ncbi:hypothetical protein PDESU_05275 [Pontiella desulfatans]|uniref:Uncharacterized protein n=1 Tax=Pontiella desulfatans TaxID=2750659 RepID=A0A6C2UBE8_PONDE|nr:hypothetical protein [Pontiella desulfatans]VGO16684.1 hypothetical protein PDESU_05275 [Pontiella desulfatans]